MLQSRKSRTFPTALSDFWNNKPRGTSESSAVESLCLDRCNTSVGRCRETVGVISSILRTCLPGGKGAVRVRGPGSLANEGSKTELPTPREVPGPWVREVRQRFRAWPILVSLAALVWKSYSGRVEQEWPGVISRL